ESNTIVLDSRSKDRYDKKHVKGAIHMAFTDFTQGNLNRLIPDPTTRILIYCNNNFMGDQVNFATKTVMPVSNTLLQDTRPVMLALNIPTFINLYGYGFKNIYELDELVNVRDSRIQFEGTDVK
ncbi:MAG: rhodanese-like domain-containing protein, partial [Pseudopedobacter saltans]